MNKFEVKKSKIQGYGVFALRNIKRGEIIWNFRGKKVSISQLKKLYSTFKERVDDPLQLGDKTYLVLKKPYFYINHSCSPNAGIKGKTTLFALKNIKKGQEIKFDYSTTEWTNDKAWGINWTKLWKFRCNCGSKNCRKWVKVFSFLPKKSIERYKKQGALPDFVLKKLKNNP